MPPLSLTARIGLLVLLSLTLVWVGSVAIFYLSVARQGGSTRPLLSQVVALVELLEQAAPAERPLLLRAVKSEGMSARVEPGVSLDVTPILQRVPRLTERALKSYLAPIGGRASSVIVPGRAALNGALPGYSFLRQLDLEMRVGLKTGETLVIDVNHPPLTNVFGLPVGFVAGLLGTVIGLIALMLAQSQTKPLARLATAVDGLDLTREPAPLQEVRSGAPEIRALVAAFNRLHGRLWQLLANRMAMLGGISHDVRTFATRLRLRVERIPQTADRDRAIADIADMIRLLDDALLASRAGAGGLDEELVEFDQVIRAEIADRHAEGKAVESSDPEGTWEEALVLGDRLALRRVVANLIDNALKYGGVARLRVETQGPLVSLTIDDQGPGIPPGEREAVLEPFVRLEYSRNRRTGGAGLGLAVVRSLVEAHRGTLQISDCPGGGARLTVRLPVYRAAG